MSYWRRFVNDVEKMKHTVKKVCIMKYFYQNLLPMPVDFLADLRTAKALTKRYEWLVEP